MQMDAIGMLRVAETAKHMQISIRDKLIHEQGYLLLPSSAWTSKMSDPTKELRLLSGISRVSIYKNTFKIRAWSD